MNKNYITTTIINTFYDKNTTSLLNQVAQRFKPKLREPAAKTCLKLKPHGIKFVRLRKTKWQSFLSRRSRYPWQKYSLFVCYQFRIDCNI